MFLCRGGFCRRELIDCPNMILPLWSVTEGRAHSLRHSGSEAEGKEFGVACGIPINKCTKADLVGNA